MDRAMEIAAQFVGLTSFPISLAYVLVCIAGCLVLREPPKTNALSSGNKTASRQNMTVGTRLMVAFNIGLTAVNLIMGMWLCWLLYVNGSIFSLQSTRVSLQPALLIMWVVKGAELFDTIFMLLRRSLRQVTFLHVYHHSTMVLLVEYAYRYAPWAGVAFGLGMNCFVHVLLYFYYAYTASGATAPLPLKKSLTQVQILQFVIGCGHAYHGFTSHGYCMYYGLFGLSMLALFSNFYFKAYMRSSPKKTYANAPVKGKAD